MSRFLYTMIEHDHISPQEQLAIYKRSNIPCVALIDSGNKSVHAIVKINAENFEEYKARVKMVRDHIGLGIDKTRDASRFMRLPNARRSDDKVTDSRQRLIAVNVGAESWEAWEDSVRDDGLPETFDMAELLEDESIKESPHLLKNFLRRGQVFGLSGGTKTYKSWTIGEMALAISQGMKFLKWEACATNVFYVDTELERFDLRKRLNLIAKSMGITLAKGEIETLSLRGIITTIDDLVEILIRRVRGKDIGLIVIDSFYSLLGDREENSNEDMREVACLLGRLAKETGAAVAITVHHGKGDQSGRRALDRIVGGGALGRGLDLALDILKHPTIKDAAIFEPTLRSFEEDPKFCARRVNHVWVVDSDIKVTEKTDGSDILDILGDQELTVKAWVEQCIENLDITKATFNRHKKKIDQFLDSRREGKFVVVKRKADIIRNEKGHYVPKPIEIEIV